MHASLVHDLHGQPEYVLHVVEDIHARKQAEESLLQLAETLEQRVAERTAQLRVLAAELTLTEQRERRRLAQVLHDHLQQLLVASKTRVGMALRSVVDDEPRQILNDVSDLLDQSLASSRSLTAELSPPILYEQGLKAALLWLARWMEQKHQISVSVEAEAGVEPAAEDVRVFLFQAVRELLFNIVKHAQAGRAQVRMERAAGDRLRIHVRDNGEGFNPEGLTKSLHGGGLGLFSIRERLELLGGAIDVASRRGRGTQVTLVVPLESEASPHDSLKASVPPRQGPAGQVAEISSGVTSGDIAANSSDLIRVLVVDDHEIVREGFVRLLTAHPSMTVIGEAGDGEEAVQRAMQLKPDVITMDITMPKLSGIEATRRIVAALPGVRVIGLSVHDHEDMAAEMKAAGAAAYLSKGGASDHLIAAIQGAIASIDPSCR